MILNKILDASVLWSFDLSGYLRHEKNFDESIIFSEGKRALITGGTSGIGKAAAQEMSKQGVAVTVTGRNLNKGNELEKSSPLIHFKSLDMTSWSEFTAFVDSIEPLDYLVLNAGSMPEIFGTNAQGIELQFASQFFGHYILAKKLSLAGKLNPGGRIVWVTSGGMYLKALDLNTIFRNPKYDKVDQYANVKRAQVTLLPFFKEEFREQMVIAMHPGWAATPGVDEALPGFSKIMKGRLRSPLQGADTILWALSTKRKIESGALYFDREKVTSHKFWFTRKSEKLSGELQNLLKKYVHSV